MSGTGVGTASPTEESHEEEVRPEATGNRHTLALCPAMGGAFGRFS